MRHVGSNLYRWRSPPSWYAEIFGDSFDLFAVPDERLNSHGPTALTAAKRVHQKDLFHPRCPVLARPPRRLNVQEFIRLLLGERLLSPLRSSRSRTVAPEESRGLFPFEWDLQFELSEEIKRVKSTCLRRIVSA